MVEAKKPYEKPQLTEYGTVSELTQVLGASFLTDSSFTGSMEFPGKGMGMM